MSIINKIYGPYFKTADENIWHWMKTCPNFPDGANVLSMVSSQHPKKETLCEQCKEIELTSSNFMDSSSIENKDNT